MQYFRLGGQIERFSRNIKDLERKGREKPKFPYVELVKLKFRRGSQLDFRVNYYMF